MNNHWDAAFSPTPEIFHARVESALTAIKEGTAMKKRVSLNALLAAALIVLALAGGIAIAAANGVFDWVAHRYADENTTKRYAQVNQLADETAQSQSALDGRVTMRLEQSYFNGVELYLGYRLAYSPELGTFTENFAPDANLLAQIKQPKNAKTPGVTIGTGDAAFESALAALLSARYDGDAYGCIAKNRVTVMDHSLVTVGETEYDVCYTQGDLQAEGDAWIGYREFRCADAANEDYALPEIPSDVREIGVGLKVAVSTTYYYADASGYYTLYTRGEPEWLRFTVRRAEAAPRTGTGRGECADYTMNVTVSATAVSTYVEAVFTYALDGIGDATDAWNSAEDLIAMGKDALGYASVTAGGETYEDGVASYGRALVNGEIVFTYVYVLPAIDEDVQEILFKPRWIVAGEKPEEVITVRLSPAETGT